MDIKVSCIIPAYNEEKTIAGVINVCLETPEIDEVIVVNDGSKDKTKEKITQFKDKIRIINLLKNAGKGHALVQGIKRAKNETLLFLDSDLVRIKPHHLASLVWPIAVDKADMTIGLLLGPKDIQNRFWFVSGQRCLKKKSLLSHLPKLEKTKYGFEIALNRIFEKKRTVVIPIIGKGGKPHLVKPNKQPDWLSSYIKEAWDITQETIKNKSKDYRAKIKKQLLKNLALYLRVNIQKIKNYLNE